MSHSCLQCLEATIEHQARALSDEEQYHLIAQLYHLFFIMTRTGHKPSPTTRSPRGGTVGGRRRAHCLVSGGIDEGHPSAQVRSPAAILLPGDCC